METSTEETKTAAQNLLDSPAVKKAKTKKAAKKMIKKAVKKAKKALKKEAKSRKMFDGAAIAKQISAWKTVKELAKSLKVTPPAAQRYLNDLSATRKVEKKEVRQGLRGPLAIAYRVG